MQDMEQAEIISIYSCLHIFTYFAFKIYFILWNIFESFYNEKGDSLLSTKMPGAVEVWCTSSWGTVLSATHFIHSTSADIILQLTPAQPPAPATNCLLLPIPLPQPSSRYGVLVSISTVAPKVMMWEQILLGSLFSQCGHAHFSILFLPAPPFLFTWGM